MRKKLNGERAKSNAGRSTVDTPEVRKKIEEATALDSTIEEVCFYAEISKPTYYEIIKRDEEFSNRLEALRNRPVLKARQTVVARMSESYSNAMDYLKRKRKIEFGDNIDITSEGKSLPTPILKIDAILRDNSNKEDKSTEEKD